MKSFQKFDSAAVAVEEATSIIEGKVTPRLASLLEELKDEKKASLAVADPKLGTYFYACDLKLTNGALTLNSIRQCHWQAARLIPGVDRRLNHRRCLPCHS